MRRKEKSQSPKIVAVDLFCGAAGLSFGLINEGIDVRAGVDFDDACRWPYEKNTKAMFIHADVAKLDSRVLKQHLANSSYTLLAGCAPCQRFSKYTQKSARRDRNRWRLLDSFGRIALELKPDIITMENVPGLTRHRRFNQFVRSLEDAGYSIWHDIVDCAEYGAPQTRRRLVVLASRLGPIEMLSPSEMRARPQTVKDAIGRLPRLEAGSSDSMDPLHRSQGLSPLNKRRIRVSRPGKSWRNWPKELVLKCHSRQTGKGYPSVYGRMEWDKPAPTITTLAYNYGSGRFGHPEQNRAISLREAALLQTFPQDYSFSDPKMPPRFTTIGRLIGNAVPVSLAQAIGRSIRTHVRNHNSKRPRKCKGRGSRPSRNELA